MNYVSLNPLLPAMLSYVSVELLRDETLIGDSQSHSDQQECLEGVAAAKVDLKALQAWCPKGLTAPSPRLMSPCRSGLSSLGPRRAFVK